VKKLLSLACILGLFVGSVALVGCSSGETRKTTKTETTTNTEKPKEKS
jgi:hypothetical protein